jgi:N-acetylmuramoyl-L-alanine amidase
MEPTTSTPQSPGKNRDSAFQHMGFLLVVAIFAATLFTAWTDPGLLPSTLAETFTNAMPGFGATPLPAFPTLTPRPSPRIGIVAGHLGNDSGAVCPDELGGVREVDINLDVASRVQANLQAEGYQVDLLNEFDQRLLAYRSVALVSIHSDSCVYVNDQATGFKIAAAMSTIYPEQAVRLTECIRARYQTVTELTFHSGSVTNDMTNYHAFDEIDPQTPAAIIEIGFMNLDYQILTQRPDLIARGITNGILCYVRNETINPVIPAEP